MLHSHADRRIAVKGHLTGQHFIQHHAHAVNIAGKGHVLAARLFGRKVVHRAHHVIALGQGAAARHAGNAKVRHLDQAFGIDQDVLGLDVAVDDTIIVRMLQSRKDADGNLRRHALRQAALFSNDLLERAPAHVFHHQIAIALLLTHIQQVYDIVMAHLAGGQRLALKALQEFLIVIELRPQNLDRHIVPRAQIGSAKNQRHAALTDKLLQPVPLGEYAADHAFTSSSSTLTLSVPPC